VIKKNNNGDITILFLTLFQILVVIFALGLNLIKKEILLQKKIIQAKNCFKEVSQEHINYVEAIERSNQIIIASKVVSLSPKIRIPMNNLIKLIKISQELKYHITLKRTLDNSNCEIGNVKEYLIGVPYLRTFKNFRREKIGTVQRKRSTYELIMCFSKLDLVVIHLYKIKEKKLKYNWKARNSYICHS